MTVSKPINWTDRDAGEKLSIVLLSVIAISFVGFAAYSVWYDYSQDEQLRLGSVGIMIGVAGFLQHVIRKWNNK
ncbi:MAG: hypothetical protein AAGH53_02515 [Pseudomonadota bacterium]